MIGIRSPDVQKRPPVRRSAADASIMSAVIAMASGAASGWMSRSTSTPAARSPLRAISQRGLSGMPKHSTV